MEVTVEIAEGLERRMKVQVPAERVDSEVDNRLKSLRGRARVDGFRPGKVPLAVIRSKFGPQVRQEVLGEVLQSSFYEAVTQEKLRPAGGPSIEPQEMGPGKALEYTATFEVYPEIEVGDLSAIKVTREKVDIADSDVETVVERLRKQRTEWHAVEREAQDGDRVTMNFTGYLGDEPFEGGAGEGAPLVLGSGSFIPGFEEQLLGVRSGESRTLTVTFPEDYQAGHLAGREARFEVEATEVAEPRLPEVDEGFVKGFGIGDGTVETFRSEIRGNMQRELDEALKSRIKQQVMDGLLEVNELQVPSALVSEEIGRLKEQAKEQMLGGQAAPKGFTLPDEIFEDQARRRVSLGLLLAEIARANEIKADADRVRETIERFASTYERPEEVVKWYYGNQEQLGNVESLVLEEQVVDWVLERAEVSEEQTTFDAVMNPKSDAKAE